MRKLFLFLLLGASFQSGELGGPVALNDPALVQAAAAARKAGLRDVMTYPKQSFTVSHWLAAAMVDGGRDVAIWNLKSLTGVCGSSAP